MLTALKIMKLLSRYDMSTNEIGKELQISTATVKREIANARHLGAIIKSRKIKKFPENECSFFYKLENWDKCKNRTERWIELEESKTVIAS